MSKFRILSIDGGGALGCGPISFMRSMQKTIPYKEDMLGGTSVGGLIVALRLAGRDWYEIEEIFMRGVGKIFEKPPLWWRMNPLKPRYRRDGLVDACKAELGNRRCRDAPVPFVVPVYDFKEGRPKIVDETDDLTLAEMVLRTTAAPTYFAPIQSRWADGGVFANNPSMLALGRVRRDFDIPMESIYILSLNTAGSFWKDPKVGDNMTKLSWIEPLIKSQLDGNEEIAEYQCETFLGDRHFRVVPNLTGKVEIDDLSVLEDYAYEWHITFMDHELELQRWEGVKP